MRTRAWRHCVVLVLVGFFGSTAHATQPADPRQIWQLLDYLAVDYRGAVRDGHVSSESEYAEMREFAGTAAAQIQDLPDRAERQQLIEAATELKIAIEERRSADDVARLAHGLADALLAAYPIPLAPKATPNLGRGQQLFESQCSGCHGIHGAGDGPAAHTLDPPPIAFTNIERARERSPFGYYQIISQGVSGTSMVSFAALSEDDRWDLAFYASTLAYTPSQRQEGEALWTKRADSGLPLANLEAVARTSEQALSRAVGTDEAPLLLAFVRSSPEVFSRNSGQSLALARSRITQSVEAYASGNPSEAQRLALSAYLDGVEPVEPMLAAANEGLLARLETTMASYRASLGQKRTAKEIADEAKAIEALFNLTEEVLSTGAATRGAAFLGSFTILVREGMEALLIVVAILAFLRKAERPELLPYVHGGWIGALVAGGLTWAVATYLVGITGAHREVTEGVSSLFAALVLLSVGLWMHSKSHAGRWQQYLNEKLSHALSRRSVWFLAGLAFIAVYREVFETILFYAALWTRGQHGALLGGLAAGTLALAVVAFLMLRATKRLPISQFFAASALLVAVLAVVLTGKGVTALQEAGLIGVHPVFGPRLDALGIYPTAEPLIAQLVVIVAVVVGYAFNQVGARRLRASVGS
jgi:high-affinity iron transporter